MIHVVYSQNDRSVLFALSVEDKVRFPNGVRSVGLYDEPEVDSDFVLRYADRWLLVVSMLPGLSEEEVERETFEMVSSHGDVLLVPEGTRFLRSDEHSLKGPVILP